jgi:hypothetical protein
VTQQDLVQGHLPKWYALEQLFAELVGGEEVDLVGSLQNIIQKVGHLGIKQRLTSGDEHLLRPEAPDHLDVEVVDLVGDTGLIQLPE